MVLRSVGRADILSAIAQRAIQRTLIDKLLFVRSERIDNANYLKSIESVILNPPSADGGQDVRPPRYLKLCET